MAGRKPLAAAVALPLPLACMCALLVSMVWSAQPKQQLEKAVPEIEVPDEPAPDRPAVHAARRALGASLRDADLATSGLRVTCAAMA